MATVLARVSRTVRAGNWWLSKLAPLLGLAAVQVLRFEHEPLRAVQLLVGALVVTGGAVGAYGHVVNDAFDITADRRAGKVNRIAGVRPAVRGLLAVSLLVVALAPAMVLDFGRTATVLLVVELLLPAAYSIPPVRLKERGLLGVLADAGAAHVLPALIVWTAFTPPGGASSLLLLGAIAVWTVCLGTKNILRHQLLDREADRSAGVRTFVAAAPRGRIRRVLALIVYPGELIAFGVLVLLLVGVVPLVAIALVVYLLLDLVKLALGWDFLPQADRPDVSWPHLPLISNTFYEVWFPLATAIELTWYRPTFFPLLLLFGMVSWRNLAAEGSDLKSMADDLGRRARAAVFRSRWGWRLELYGGAAARIGRRRDGDKGCRVEVSSPGALPWHVKLSRGPMTVQRSSPRQLRVEMRADAPRVATWCLVRGRPPWDSLGLSEEVALDDPWRTVVLPVRVTGDAADAELCLLVGGDATPVELGPVCFEADPGFSAGSNR